MSIFSTADSGTKVYRSRFELKPRKTFNCRFGDLIPAFAMFVNPNDVWKINTNMLIRFQPMLSPSLTRCWARIRYFFVPLRLVEENTELILTGSKEGKLYNQTLPSFEGFFDRVSSGVDKKVELYSFGDYFTMPVMDYSSIYQNKCIPASYWIKSYLRCWFDYYRDENLNDEDDFDSFVDSYLKANNAGLASGLLSVNLHKDYFVSSLPWQLKGATPTFSVGGTLDFTNSIGSLGDRSFNSGAIVGFTNLEDSSQGLKKGLVGGVGRSSYVSTGDVVVGDSQSTQLLEYLNKGQIIGGSFDMNDLRTMAAQTRIFERLARCGSRYTEYLRANFNTSPADGTLQRAQYLGGQTQPVVMTEVVQTAADGTNPVGTLRGHGISNDVGSIKPFVSKEFGVILGLFDIMPEIMYTQGIDRQYSYKSRFDFFNPSFQHLSEQEVRNGEIFMSADDGKNDDTFGFQSMYNELRSSRNSAVADMRGNLAYWTQAVSYTSRPNLNNEFINSKNYLSNFNQPFAVTSSESRNVIVDFGPSCDVYRTMTNNGTPGLIDHL